MSFWCFEFFQKTNENNSTWGIIVVNSNLFARFLEELKTPKRHFETDWPLAIEKLNVFAILLKHVSFVSHFMRHWGFSNLVIWLLDRYVALVLSFFVFTVLLTSTNWMHLFFRSSMDFTFGLHLDLMGNENWNEIVQQKNLSPLNGLWNEFLQNWPMYPGIAAFCRNK